MSDPHLVNYLRRKKMIANRKGVPSARNYYFANGVRKRGGGGDNAAYLNISDDFEDSHSGSPPRRDSYQSTRKPSSRVILS
jgi:hypothetical protein